METKILAQQLGISHQMANCYKAKGMPTDSLESATAWRKSNIDPFRSKTGRIGGNTGAKSRHGKIKESSPDIGDMIQQVNGSQLDLDSTDADILFKNSRALKEKAMALQAAAEHSKFIGELVERDHVERIVFERARQFRDGLMACSRRIAPEIVGKTNITNIESLMDCEFRSVLENFSKLPVIEK